MATVDERDLALGRLYAGALLDLAEASGQPDSLGEELHDLVRAVGENPELADFLSTPLVDDEMRAATLEKTLRGKASDLFVDALQVIRRKGRLGKLPAIAEAYRLELRQRRGLVDAQVISAVPLSAPLRAQLTESLRRFSGREPHLVERVDPALLGGTVVKIAGQKIDTSVATHLRELSEALLARASREIQSGKAYLAE
jgi:F-type H+-transporting ATPase subunit delta